MTPKSHIPSPIWRSERPATFAACNSKFLTELEAHEKKVASGSSRRDYLNMQDTLAKFANDITPSLRNMTGQCDMLTLYCMSLVNSTGAFNDDIVALFPATAHCVNHSCSPNANLSCEVAKEYGIVHSLYAIKDIEAGEEINMTYTDLLRPTRDRQRSLREVCMLCRALILRDLGKIFWMQLSPLWESNRRRQGVRRY